MRPSDRVLGIVLAVCVVVAPLVLAAWFGLCPQYDNPGCPSPGAESVFDAFRTAPAAALEAFLVVNLVAPYLYPLSYVGLGVAAWRRAPWLALAGIACGWLGSMPWGMIADQAFQTMQMAQAGHDAVFAHVERQFGSSWQLLIVFATWVGGHLIGYVLLAVALARSRVAPPWAAALLIAGAVLMGPVAYPSHLGLLQVAGYVAVAVGSWPAAAVLARSGGQTTSATVPRNPAPHT